MYCCWWWQWQWKGSSCRSDEHDWARANDCWGGPWWRGGLRRHHQPAATIVAIVNMLLSAAAALILLWHQLLAGIASYMDSGMSMDKPVRYLEVHMHRKQALRPL